jgi:hypothetical protein
LICGHGGGDVAGPSAQRDPGRGQPTAIVQKLWDVGIDKSIIEALIATPPERTHASHRARTRPITLVRCLDLFYDPLNSSKATNLLGPQ